MNYENRDKEKLIEILTLKDDMLKRLYLEKEKLNYYVSIKSNENYSFSLSYGFYEYSQDIKKEMSFNNDYQKKYAYI